MNFTQCVVNNNIGEINEMLWNATRETALLETSASLFFRSFLQLAAPHAAARSKI